MWRDLVDTFTNNRVQVGNKVDLERSRQVAPEEGKELASSYEAKFIETSAGLKHNVDELLVGVLKQILLRQDPDPGHPHAVRVSTEFCNLDMETWYCDQYTQFWMAPLPCWKGLLCLVLSSSIQNGTDRRQLVYQISEYSVDIHHSIWYQHQNLVTPLTNTSK